MSDINPGEALEAYLPAAMITSLEVINSNGTERKVHSLGEIIEAALQEDAAALGDELTVGEMQRALRVGRQVVTELFRSEAVKIEWADQNDARESQYVGLRPGTSQPSLPWGSVIWQRLKPRKGEK